MLEGLFPYRDGAKFRCFFLQDERFCIQDWRIDHRQDCKRHKHPIIVLNLETGEVTSINEAFRLAMLIAQRETIKTTENISYYFFD
jgi:hypothetical protein